MHRLLLTVFAVGAMAGSAPATAQAQGYYPSVGADARVWIQNDRDVFRRGDRLDVRFRVSHDAYVAVFHIDPDGYLDVVYPASPWDNEFVRGQRTQTVRMRGNSTWTVRNSSGIGYFYIVASPGPLDFASFRGSAGSPWDWGYAGRTVRGDPFLAFDQITRLLLPWGNEPYSVDYYSYHVGRIHSYPTFACSDRYYSGGWGWTPSYGSCSRLNGFLRGQPYYYDTRRYRNDRRVVLRQWDRLDPRHGFKESPGQPARPVTPRDNRAPAPSAQPAPGVDRREPVPARPAPERATPARETPPRATPSRPPARGETSRSTPPAARPAREPAREPARSTPPQRSTPAARPARETSRPRSTSQPRGNAAPERSRPTPSTGTRSPAPSRGGGSAESPRTRPGTGQS